MKLKKHLAFVLALVTAGAASANDLTLKFSKPAQFFEETFVLGNGTQGAIVYGDPGRERISLNDITLWTGEPDTAVYSPDAYKSIPAIREALDKGDFVQAEELQKAVQGRFTNNYQPVGNLFIDFADKSYATGYLRTLDLNDATARVRYTKGNNDIRTEYIYSAPDSVMAVHLTSSKPMTFTVSFDSQLPCSVDAQGDAILARGHAAYTSMPSYTGNAFEKIKYEDGRGIKFATAITADAKSGRVSAADGKLTVTDTRDVTLWVSSATNFAGARVNPSRSTINAAEVAQRRVAAAEKRGLKSVEKRHREDYAALFDRVEVDFGETAPALAAMDTDGRLKHYADTGEADPDLEEMYFQYGRYLLISCSRTPRVPANLQGLWNEYILPPWSANYTVNINLEENYWPAGVTNLSELQMPLLTFIEQLPETGRDTARHYYGVDKGWCLGHNSDLWAITNPVGLNNGAPMWANWNMGGAWLSSHIWDHYQFTGDKETLARFYPALKGAAEFCLGWLVEDKDGYLVTSPSTSPENRFKTREGRPIATSTGGYADLAMVRQCLTDTRLAAQTLGVDSELCAEIDGVMPRLAPYRVGADGHLLEWAEDWPEEDPQHRHQSHLYGLYPGNHITVEGTPDLAAAASKSLEIKGENTTGWSTGWRVNLLARLQQADKAYSMYRRLLRYVSPDNYKGEDSRRGGGTYPNLLDAHSPFQIDGNFGGTAGVAEMLIQSTPETITILPAVPAEWQNGRFKGLRARGAVTVDAEWKDGKVKSLTLTADKDTKKKVTFNGRTVDVTLKAGKPHKISN